MNARQAGEFPLRLVGTAVERDEPMTYVITDPRLAVPVVSRLTSNSSITMRFHARTIDGNWWCH